MEGSGDADAGNYINRDGSNTVICRRHFGWYWHYYAYRVPEVSGGYAPAGGGLKVSGEPEDVAGTIWSQPAVVGQTATTTIQEIEPDIQRLVVGQAIHISV